MVLGKIQDQKQKCNLEWPNIIYALQLQIEIWKMMADGHTHARYHMLVLFLIFSGTNSLVYKILPSSRYSCQTQPCLTLSQFAFGVSSYLQSNTTLIFQPGNHILDVTLRVESVLTLQLSSILPHSTTIVCEHSRLNLVNISSIYVGKLTFVGCSGRGESIGHLLIEDTMFFGQN